MKPSERLNESAQTIREFRDAYAELVKAHERTSGGAPLAVKRKVASLAGAASIAAGTRDTAIRVDMPALAGGKVIGFPAIQGWEYPFSSGGMFVEPEFLLIAYDQILGGIEEEARQAARRERSPLGRLARFIGLPLELREHLRYLHPSIAKAGVPAGIAAQILIAVTIAVLSAPGVRVANGVVDAVVGSPASVESPAPIEPTE